MNFFKVLNRKIDLSQQTQEEYIKQYMSDGYVELTRISNLI